MGLFGTVTVGLVTRRISGLPIPGLGAATIGLTRATVGLLTVGLTRGDPATVSMGLLTAGLPTRGDTTARVTSGEVSETAPTPAPIDTTVGLILFG